LNKTLQSLGDHVYRVEHSQNFSLEPIKSEVAIVSLLLKLPRTYYYSYFSSTVGQRTWIASSSSPASKGL